MRSFATATAFTLTCVSLAHARPQAEDVRPQEEAKQQEPEKSPEDQARDAIVEFINTEVNREVKRVLIAQFLLELQDMAKMHELTETQLRKLSVAARGAASKAVDGARANNRATVVRMLERRLGEPNVSLRKIRFNGRSNAVDLPEEVNRALKPADDAGKEELGVTVSRRGYGFYFTVRYQNGSSSTSVGPRDTEVRKQEIFTKAAEGILTPAQMSDYQKLRAGRLKRAVVSMLMAELGFQLSLQEEQLPAVREKLNKKVTVSGISSLSGLDSILRSARQKLDPKDFESVLSDVQYDVFESIQAYHRRYLR